MGINLFDFLTMLGGLALFLYGMLLLCGSLSSLSGGKLRRKLERLTDTPLKAVFTGAGVTAVIQSSSTATVMVVGLVDSGMLNLKQAAGVIMGANIGTTVTAWILALAGRKSDSFWVRLLNPVSLAPLAALMCVLFLLFSRNENEKEKGLASAGIGFFMLLFGMETMSGAAAPLSLAARSAGVSLVPEHSLLGVLLGMVLTMLIQSSSASVGILQALCASGTISMGSAFPFLLGQNIGTCITALLSGVGASVNARRAAVIHLYFNVFGTLFFLGGFYLSSLFFPFSFWQKAAGSFEIALAHSIFNVGTTVLLFPFQEKLVRLSCRTLREGGTCFVGNN